MNTPPTPPHVVVGDEVYYRHPEKGVLSGPVASAGKDGVRVRQGDEHHGVTWEHLLGHKTRKIRRMKIVERGEDGFLAEDEHGQREYVAGEAPEEEEAPEDKKVAPEEKPVKAEPMTKAMDQAILDAALIKAGFTPSLDYIRATYGDHWSLREDPAVDALWTALADGRARTDEALQGLRADLVKAHVNAYTRSDGTFVQAHEDSRVAAKDPIDAQDDIVQPWNVKSAYKKGGLVYPQGGPMVTERWLVPPIDYGRNRSVDFVIDAGRIPKMTPIQEKALREMVRSSISALGLTKQPLIVRFANSASGLTDSGIATHDTIGLHTRYLRDWLKNGVNDQETLSTLVELIAHEMVHVWQHTTGLIVHRWDQDGKYSGTYRGQRGNEDGGKPYDKRRWEDRPWEQEAESMQGFIAKKVIDDLVGQGILDPGMSPATDATQHAGLAKEHEENLVKCFWFDDSPIDESIEAVQP